MKASPVPCWVWQHQNCTSHPETIDCHSVYSMRYMYMYMCVCVYIYIYIYAEIYIVSGLFSLWLNICLYMDFTTIFILFLSYENILDNHIQSKPSFQSNVVVYPARFIPKFYVKFYMPITYRSNIEARLQFAIFALDWGCPRRQFSFQWATHRCN